MGMQRAGSSGSRIPTAVRCCDHAAKAAGPGTAPRVDTWIKLCFVVDDVDRERAALVERGVTMRDVHRWEGIAFCDGVDPEGNIFQITTRR